MTNVPGSPTAADSRNVANRALPVDHGGLPPWNVSDLPAPPPFNSRNLLKVIGPGAIMAATSIGGGEWLVGPAAAVKYSAAIFLIAAIAIVLPVVFLFLIVVNVAFVPLSHWWQTFTGFFSVAGLRQPIDWGLIGALAATAGSGGMGNLTVTNWVRDKGFGMGSKVGAIPSAVG